MFIEPKIIDQKEKGKSTPGWVEVICGSMFSGKTEELIRRLNRAILAKQQVAIFKPTIDNRYDEQKIVSHNQNSIDSTPVKMSHEIITRSEHTQVIGIDEAQFFEADIVEVVKELANQGKRVIVAGLDMDFEGQPFGSMPALIATAEYVTKVRAICMKCGNVASYSYRLSSRKEKVLIGEKEAYEARCRSCFYE